MSRSITGQRFKYNENNLKEAIKKIHETRDFSDVTFTVDGRKFKAHKLILASRCSAFSSLLESKDFKDVIVEEDAVSETGFEILLQFIYTDTLGTSDKQSIVKAYLTGMFYQQKKLMEKCEEQIQNWILSVDDVCELLNVSLGIPLLKDRCLNFIRNNAIDVIQSQTFFKLDYKAMICILDNNALDAVEVKKRLTKIVEWGARQQNNPEDYAAVRVFFLKQNPPILGKLKIEELQLSDITELLAVSYKGLLTSDEIVKFMQYQSVRDSAVLPEWCTST